jgi:hypothetical protein
LDNFTTNENKIRKNKSILLIVSATFFDQHQSTAVQIDLDHSDTSNENSVKIMELSIKFSDKCYEWYLDLCVSAYFINNKWYFKNYR